jgi:hypothetical protein
MAKTDTFTYSTAYLTASMIKYGQAQGLIAQHASQGRVLHSAHTVRDKDGEDVVLLIFQPEAHAKEFGGNQPIPANITNAIWPISEAQQPDSSALPSDEQMTQWFGPEGSPERERKMAAFLLKVKSEHGIV